MNLTSTVRRVALGVVALTLVSLPAAAVTILTFEEKGLPTTDGPSTFEVGELRFSGAGIIDLSSSPYVNRALPSPVHGISIGPESSAWSYIVSIERVGGGQFDLKELSFAVASGTSRYLILDGYKNGELHYRNYSPPSRLASDNGDTYLTFRPNFHDADRITLALNNGGDYLFAAVDNIVYEVAPIPVPEPKMYALMIVGLGVLGFMARRRET